MRRVYVRNLVDEVADLTADFCKLLYEKMNMKALKVAGEEKSSREER